MLLLINSEKMITCKNHLFNALKRDKKENKKIVTKKFGR